jgi:hypothetical protein
MFNLIRCAALVTLLISVPSWSQAQTAAPYGLSDAERAAVRALLEKAPKDGKRRFFDLTNPSEELALRALLRVNGRTPQNRPHQFRMIEERKAEQRAERTRQGQLSLEPAKAARLGTAAVPVPEDIDQVINIGTNDWKTISSAVVSSYYGGTLWSQATVNVFDAGGTAIAAGSGEQYGDGKLLVAQSDDGANPGGEGVTTLGTFFYIDKGTGKKMGPLYASITGGYYPKQITETKPQITTTNKNVVVCLNRANPDPNNPTKCDYGPTDPNVPNDKVKVKIPFTGSIQYFNKIEVDPTTKKPPVGTYTVSLYLIGQTTGGGCSGQEIGDTFMGNPNTVVNGDTISWDMEYADFGHVCYKNNEFYTLTFSLMLTFSKVPIWATITNDPTTKPTVSTLKIPAMQIQYGCVLEGAEVLMADGSKRRIEDVKIGDQVASRKGPLRVNSTTVGWDFDFVELAHDARGKVTVTLDHPVVTQRGLIRASDVKRSDVVYSSDRGRPSAKITGVKLLHEPKARRVYNLMLTEPNGPPPGDVADANFYAGNVLIGDAEGQRQLMRSPAQTASVRARLPAEMRVDFDNWVKEQAARK